MSMPSSKDDAKVARGPGADFKVDPIDVVFFETKDKDDADFAAAIAREAPKVAGSFRDEGKHRRPQAAGSPNLGVVPAAPADGLTGGTGLGTAVGNADDGKSTIIRNGGFDPSMECAVDAVRRWLHSITTKLGPNNVLAAQWWQNVFRKSYRPGGYFKTESMGHFMIGTFGEPGHGKSSLFNALLGIEDFLPCVSGIACTAKPVRVRYAPQITVDVYLTSPIKCITSRRDWASASLLNLHNDVDIGNFNRDRLVAIYPSNMRSPGTYNDAVRKQEEKKFLQDCVKDGTFELSEPWLAAIFKVCQPVYRRTADGVGADPDQVVWRLNFSEIPKLKSFLARVVAKNEKDDDTEPDSTHLPPNVFLWPLVNKVIVSGPFPNLRGGLTLVDLPGFMDNDPDIRESTVDEAKRCHRLLVCKDTLRPEISKEYWQQHVAGLGISNATVVLTKIDSINAKGELTNLPNKFKGNLRSIFNALKIEMKGKEMPLYLTSSTNFFNGKEGKSGLRDEDELWKDVKDQGALAASRHKERHESLVDFLYSKIAKLQTWRVSATREALPQVQKVVDAIESLRLDMKVLVTTTIQNLRWGLFASCFPIVRSLFSEAQEEHLTSIWLSKVMSRRNRRPYLGFGGELGIPDDIMSTIAEYCDLKQGSFAFPASSVPFAVTRAECFSLRDVNHNSIGGQPSTAACILRGAREGVAFHSRTKGTFNPVGDISYAVTSAIRPGWTQFFGSREDDGALFDIAKRLETKLNYDIDLIVENFQATIAAFGEARASRFDRLKADAHGLMREVMDIGGRMRTQLLYRENGVAPVLMHFFRDVRSFYTAVDSLDRNQGAWSDALIRPILSCLERTFEEVLRAVELRGDQMENRIRYNGRRAIDVKSLSDDSWTGMINHAVGVAMKIVASASYNTHVPGVGDAKIATEALDDITAHLIVVSVNPPDEKSRQRAREAKERSLFEVLSNQILHLETVENIPPACAGPYGAAFKERILTTVQARVLQYTTEFPYTPSAPTAAAPASVLRAAAHIYGRHIELLNYASDVPSRMLLVRSPDARANTRSPIRIQANVFPQAGQDHVFVFSST